MRRVGENVATADIGRAKARQPIDEIADGARDARDDGRACRADATENAAKGSAEGAAEEASLFDDGWRFSPLVHRGIVGCGRAQKGVSLKVERQAPHANKRLRRQGTTYSQHRRRPSTGRQTTGAPERAPAS